MMCVERYIQYVTRKVSPPPPFLHSSFPREKEKKVRRNDVFIYTFIII